VTSACTSPTMFGSMQSFGDSQGAGFSQGVGAPQGNQASQGAGKTTRQEDTATCLPVTVRIIEGALASRGDDGADTKNLVLSRTIVRISPSQESSLSLILSDVFSSVCCCNNPCCSTSVRSCKRSSRSLARSSTEGLVCICGLEDLGGLHEEVYARRTSKTKPYCRGTCS